MPSFYLPRKLFALTLYLALFLLLPLLNFVTAETSETSSPDTKFPVISDLKVIGTLMSSKETKSKALTQIIITWNTDEPSTSKVEYVEGSSTNYIEHTQTDTNLTLNHSVVLSNLPPSQIYHLHVISVDKAGNEAVSSDRVTVTPKITPNAFTLVVNKLTAVFGYIIPGEYINNLLKCAQ